MIPLSVPNLTGNEREYLNKCIDTTFVSSVGEYVNRIEKMVAEESRSHYAVATSSGTTGLHLALTGCGVQRDEIVIIPTFTFIASANAVMHCGAIPWLIDISYDSWTMDPEKLKAELEKKTMWENNQLIHKESKKRVAAIMPVYTLGNIPDVEKINAIAKEYGLLIVADAAAALGAEYKERALSELADLTVFSFNGNKTVTAGGGGMVVGNDDELLKKLKHLSTTARVTAEYDHDMVGYNYRMTNIQAAVGCAQLERLEEFVEKKRRIRDFYNREFKSIDKVSLFPDMAYGKSSCWFSGIVLKRGGIEKIRIFCEKLRDKGIEARSFWKPIHQQKPYEKAIKADDLSVASNLWNRILTLPCSTNITLEELKYVSKTVKEIIDEE